MASVYVLDACVLIAYLQKEAGREKVSAFLTQATDQSVTLLLHKATVAEVYYDTLYTSSEEDADICSFNRLVACPFNLFLLSTMNSSKYSAFTKPATKPRLPIALFWLPAKSITPRL